MAYPKYTFQSANRGKGRARLDYILTKQADRRLVRCVKVRSPPLESAKSDHNLVYATTVHIPRRSAPNRRRKEITKATRKTADLQQLMADSDLRRQVASAMSAALSPIPNGTCISDIAADVADLCFPFRQKLYRALRARADHGVGARTLACRMI